MNKIIILRDDEINDLKSYDYLIKEAADAAHFAIDKLIIAETMMSYGTNIDKEAVVDLIRTSINLVRLSRDQNKLLFNYLSEINL